MKTLGDALGACPDIDRQTRKEFQMGRGCLGPKSEVSGNSPQAGQRKRCGFMPMPTPGGVPVVMMSPGSSVMNWLT